MFDKIITGIIAIGSMFYSTISGVSPEFEPCIIFSRGDHVIISTELTNCYSEDLDKIFQTGQEIRIQFEIEVFAGDSDTPAQVFRIFHSIKFSLLDHYYEVYYSEDEEIYQFETLGEAKDYLCNLSDYQVLTRDQLMPGAQHQISVSAFMGKIHLPDIHEEINLMFYWNSIKPEVDTQFFTTAIFNK